MFNNQIVIAAIRIDVANSAEARPELLAGAIESVRNTGLVDVVVVLTDSESALSAARANNAVDRFVGASVSLDEALDGLLDSEDGFIDEDENPWVLMFDLSFDDNRAQALAAATQNGQPGDLRRLRRG